MPLYELEEGSSRKFYRIELHGNRVHLHWGRIGTEGEHQVLAHGNEAAARAEYQRQLDKRTSRGYRLVVDEGKPHDPASIERARLEQTGALSTSPRFLFVHRKRKRTAWVEAAGSALIVSDGGGPTTTAFASAAEAVRERDAVVAKLMSQGYELDTFGAKEPPKKRTKAPLAENPELERAVAEDPYDEGAWTVLEDWLLQQDDPRAELVRLAKANQRADEAQARGIALPQLLGAKHGPLARAAYPATWRAGYLVETDYSDPARGAQALAESFYAAPAARLIRRLDLHVERSHLEQIAKSPCRFSLRHLTVHPMRHPEPVVVETRMLAAVEKLESLRIGSPSQLAGTVALPMRELSVVLATREAVVSWCAGSFPALRTLHLQLEDRPRMRFGDDIAPLCERAMAPALENLVIHVRSREAAKLLRTIVETSALRAQLRALAIEPLGR